MKIQKINDFLNEKYDLNVLPKVDVVLECIGIDDYYGFKENAENVGDDLENWQWTENMEATFNVKLSILSDGEEIDSVKFAITEKFETDDYCENTSCEAEVGEKYDMFIRNYRKLFRRFTSNNWEKTINYDSFYSYFSNDIARHYKEFKNGLFVDYLLEELPDELDRIAREALSRA